VSILIDVKTRALVQGITGATARIDTERCLRYGTRIVAGVSPGKGGEAVHGVPVYDSVRRALAAHPAEATVVYAPAAAVKEAVLEALDAGLRLILVTAEFVPAHDATYIVATARDRGARLIGCNTNGIISPGKCRLGGIGGIDPSEIYLPGTIGVCSRSGGMSAEISLTLKESGFGVSTCVSMGGDRITGMRMADYLLLFEADPETAAIVLFGEPGTTNEQEAAELVARGSVRKPVIALVVGAFQERYPSGVSFGHVAAMIASDADTASAKRRALAQAGVQICAVLEDIPRLLRQRLPSSED
jgi:succinyl-CoA synthetase alpha subunit